MKAKEVYGILQPQLGPLLAARGFSKQKGSRLTFQKRVGDKYHSVWFQCGKHGWDTFAGGEFFANFTVSVSPDVEGGARRQERLNHFLSDDELARARDYSNEIVARIPKPPESYFEMLEEGYRKSISGGDPISLVDTIRGYFEPDPMPYRRHQDFSMRYWEPADVSGWAAMMAPVLSEALAEMETWSVPAT